MTNIERIVRVRTSLVNDALLMRARHSQWAPAVSGNINCVRAVDAGTRPSPPQMMRGGIPCSKLYARNCYGYAAPVQLRLRFWRMRGC
eukprot:6174017-Pleurochrysis_carterae.AAC.1